MAENNPKQPKRAPTTGGFKPGQSGNPGGRPKLVGDIQALARQHTEMAINSLVRVASSEDAPPAAVVAAATALLDRGWGKPRQDIDLRTHIAVARAADADLLAIAFAGGGAVAASEEVQIESEGVVH